MPIREIFEFYDHSLGRRWPQRGADHVSANEKISFTSTSHRVYEVLITEVGGGKWKGSRWAVPGGRVCACVCECEDGGWGQSAAVG